MPVSSYGIYILILSAFSLTFSYMPDLPMTYSVPHPHVPASFSLFSFSLPPSFPCFPYHSHESLLRDLLEKEKGMRELTACCTNLFQAWRENKTCLPIWTSMVLLWPSLLCHSHLLSYSLQSYACYLSAAWLELGLTPGRFSASFLGRDLVLPPPHFCLSSFNSSLPALPDLQNTQAA